MDILVILNLLGKRLKNWNINCLELQILWFFFSLKSAKIWDELINNGKFKQINMLNCGKYGYSFDTYEKIV